MADLEIDLSNLKLGWELRHPEPPLCAACGKKIDRDENEDDEVPLWMFRKFGGKTFALAFHWNCARLRMQPPIVKSLSE